MHNRRKEYISRICSKICSSTCFAPFACERKTWQPASATSMPKCGKAEKCPLLQFDAENEEEKPDFFDGQRIMMDDTWTVCGECSHAKVEKGTVSIEGCYEDICLDCPIQMIRENITEAMAEASML